jgi:hypothetical protein
MGSISNINKQKQICSVIQKAFLFDNFDVDATDMEIVRSIKVSDRPVAKSVMAALERIYSKVQKPRNS